MEVQAIVSTLITVLDLIERVNLNKTVSSEDREKIIAERTKLRKLLVEEANAPLEKSSELDDITEDPSSGSQSPNGLPSSEAAPPPADLSPSSSDVSAPLTSDEVTPKDETDDASTDSQ